jgi:SulP family sulfate permease
MALASVFPVFNWGRAYNRGVFFDDLVAALVITMMMIPQALAYALLAGLPPQLGLYASILPLLVYALFGSSGALSVGPFAISSIMTATALGLALPSAELAEHVAAAVVLALLCGVFLLCFGLLRLGFLSNFLSFPVVSGFISASALVIGASQLGNLLGITLSGANLVSILGALPGHAESINLYTLLMGCSVFLFIVFMPRCIRRLALLLGFTPFLATVMSKLTPILAMALAIVAVLIFDLEQHHVAIIADIPQGLPVLQWPDPGVFDWPLSVWQSLISSAVLISVIGFVSAVSVAQSFAAKQRQRIDPNQEAIGLGMANLAAGFSGAFPVAASLSRSSVSFNAGARTPAAGAYTAIGVCLSTLFFTPYLYHLPIAALAALILTAVISLIDVAAIKRTWRYSYKDFAALILTALLTLINGVELGLISGVVLSIALHLYRSSHPHVAILGKLPGTEHFRDPQRHQVELDPDVISFRIEADLYFANARFLEDQVNALLADHPQAKHLILMCASINDIDASALESLYSIDQTLRNANMQFHLSEVKGPVLDRLQRSDFIASMSGNLYVSHYQAWVDLTRGRVLKS